MKHVCRDNGIREKENTYRNSRYNSGTTGEYDGKSADGTVSTVVLNLSDDCCLTYA
jgi:hypothetical protein